VARFVSLAELKRHALFLPFARFVEVDDDLEESSSAADLAEGAEDASPDRPPSDLQIARLALPGEVYALSYEENCGEDLEDRRNLHHVLVERRDGDLREVLRKSLCGEAEHGFALDLADLSRPGSRDLVVRTWIVDPDGASEHSLRVFGAAPGGLREVGHATDAVDGAVRFDAAYRRAGRIALVEVGVHIRREGGSVREVHRYKVERGALVALSQR
jgi:hypothetical protein